jgi:hypothetical protein
MYFKDMIKEFSVGSYILTLNIYSLNYVKDKTTLPHDNIVEFYEYLRKFKKHDYVFRKELEERSSIIKFLEVYDLSVKSIMKYETPDFIINGNIGVEVLNYKLKKYAVLMDYVYKRKNSNLSKKEMKSILGKEVYYDLINTMNPSVDIDSDTITAYTVPGLDLTDIQLRKKYFLSEVINKKLEMYSRGEYQKFEMNYLLIYLDFASCVENATNINIAYEIKKMYPNILTNYDLQIFIIDPFYVLKCDFDNESVIRIKSSLS